MANAKWEETVEEFIETHRSILEDPDGGHGALSRTYVHGTELITPLGKKSEEAARRATKATNDLTAAINDPRCSAGKVDKREKEYSLLLSEHERLLRTFNLLSDFTALVKQRLDNEFDEDGARKTSASVAVEVASRDYADYIAAADDDVVTFARKPEHRSWWQRLFDGKAEV